MNKIEIYKVEVINEETFINNEGKKEKRQTTIPEKIDGFIYINKELISHITMTQEFNDFYVIHMNNLDKFLINKETIKKLGVDL